jgi:hypothetical protein
VNYFLSLVFTLTTLLLFLFRVYKTLLKLTNILTIKEEGGVKDLPFFGKSIVFTGSIEVLSLKILCKFIIIICLLVDLYHMCAGDVIV